MHVILTEGQLRWAALGLFFYILFFLELLELSLVS